MENAYLFNCIQMIGKSYFSHSLEMEYCVPSIFQSRRCSSIRPDWRGPYEGVQQPDALHCAGRDRKQAICHRLWK